jgi:O-Antigen ligase
MRTVREDPERQPSPPPRAPSGTPVRRPVAEPRYLGVAAALALAAGVVCWAVGAGIVALWLFAVAAVALALALPMPLAMVSPLFAGLAGWLVDMLPLVVLVGWGAVAGRWAWSLWREKRLPRGGRWRWLPLGLAAWTTLGLLGVGSADIKRFALLLGVQVLMSATLLAVVDCLSSPESRERLASGLAAFVIVLSVGVFLEWIGVPIQELKDPTVADRVEAAYGVDAFTNSLEMIKYVRSSKAGAPALRDAVEGVREAHPSLPPADVFKPKFQAWRQSLLVRFEGSARPFEKELSEAAGIELLFDNVGLAPANTVPRMRSFPRNSLTYAGTCAALFPMALYLGWRSSRRDRLLGYAAVAACLFGAAFSLARGAWLAAVIGALYLLVDGVLPARRKLEAVGAIVVAALVITGVFFIGYGVDPLSARGEAEGSVNTRQELYIDTANEVASGGLALITGYGTETARGAGGSSHVLGRYIPNSGTHSTYLNYLYRTGIVGAALLIAIYALSALHGRAAARLGAARDRLFATTVTASVVVVAAHGMVLSLYVEPVYTLTVSLLLGLAMAVGLESQAPLLRRRDSVPR